MKAIRKIEKWVKKIVVQGLNEKEKEDKSKEYKLSNSRLVLNDIFSQNILAPLITNYPYLPFTDASVDFHSLSVLMNDIVINQRKSIIEFGGGISTFLVGRLIKLNKLDAKLYTVENSEEWCDLLRKKITGEGLQDYIEIVYAPLEEITFIKGHFLPWYSTRILDEKLKNIRFDMVFVDGPAAYMEEIKTSRLPALYYVKDKLKNKFGLFLHDSNRNGEIFVINSWKKELNIPHRYFTTTLCGFVKGSEFAIEVLNS